MLTQTDGAWTSQPYANGIFSTETGTEFGNARYIEIDYDEFVVPSNVKCSVGFYARCTAGTREVAYELVDYNAATLAETVYTGTITLTTTFQLFTIDATTRKLNPHSVRLTLSPVAGEPETIVQLYGYTVFKTVDGYTYSPSTTSTYDDITDDILNLRWQLGSNNFYGSMPFEGTLEIKLANVDKKYSPAYTDSPLHGSLKMNLRTIVQMKKPTETEWTTMWTGWTESYAINAGSARERNATIKARQGIFRFKEGSIVINPYRNERIHNVMHTLVVNSGWLLGYYNENFDPDAYDIYDVWERLDTGVNLYEYIGDGWNTTVDLNAAMKDLLDAEDAKLILNRRGMLELRNRNSVAYTGNPKAIINIDEINKTEYEYGARMINTVEVSVTPKETSTDKVIWDSKGDINVPANGTSERFKLEFSFEEGLPKSIENIQLNQDNMDVHVAYYKRPNPTDEYQNASEITDPVILANVTINAEQLDNGDVYVFVQNDNEFTVFVAFKIKGDFIRSGEGIIYVYEDADAIADSKAVFSEKITTKIATKPSHTKGIASYRLLRDAYPSGEFTSFELVAKDSDTVDLIKYLSIGDIVLVSETQTGEVNKPHVVTGEQANAKNGVLKITYQMARILESEYFKLGEQLDNKPLYI